MSGLDPLGRYQMEDYSLLQNQGKTIFNSHILSEVEQFAIVAILAQGELICSGFLEQLLGLTLTKSGSGR